MTAFTLSTWQRVVINYLRCYWMPLVLVDKVFIVIGNALFESHGNLVDVISDSQLAVV